MEKAKNSMKYLTFAWISKFRCEIPTYKHQDFLLEMII